MSLRDFLFGLVRHSGYALVCGMGLLVVVERLMPGFSTPYFNPYMYVGVGLVLMSIGSQPCTKNRLGRSLFAMGLVVILGFLLTSRYQIQSNGLFWLMVVSISLLVAFGFASIYSEKS